MSRVRVRVHPAPPGPAGHDLVAAVTRQAYAGSDPVPGLPVPDGARDSAADVARDVGRGARLWLVSVTGRPAGALRSRPAGNAHRIERVSVLPAWRGRGVAAAAVARLEDLLGAEGVTRTEVDAVVERGLPPVYAALGYRPVAHWRSDDKPLSEVTMRRELSAPRRPAPPGPGAEPDEGWPVSWYAGRDETTALCTGPGPVAALVPAHHLAVARRTPGAVWVGVDVWPDDPRAALAPRAPGAALTWPCPPGEVAAQLMPRTVRRDALALWRVYGRRRA